MQDTHITAHGEASWNRLPDGIKEKVLHALQTPTLDIYKKPLRGRPGIFSVRVDGLRIVFTEKNSVPTILSVLTASEFNALGGA